MHTRFSCDRSWLLESPPPPEPLAAAGCAGVSAMRLPGPPAGMGGGGGPDPRLGAELAAGGGADAVAELAPASEHSQGSCLGVTITVQSTMHRLNVLKIHRQHGELGSPGSSCFGDSIPRW